MNVESTRPQIETARLIGLPLVILATLLLPIISRYHPAIISLKITSQNYVNQLLTYQLITFGLTAVVLLALYLIGPLTFSRYFRAGQRDATVEPVRALGINTNGKETWRQVGRNFAIIITAVTSLFLYLTLLRGQTVGPVNWGYLLFVPLLAAVNAFVEEAITRFGVVVTLEGFLPRGMIYLASAALFGGVHYFGTPGGFAGVAMAGFLGWLLAKSVVETRGIFWAWFIHFLQDVVIFGALFLVNM